MIAVVCSGGSMKDSAGYKNQITLVDVVDAIFNEVITLPVSEIIDLVGFVAVFVVHAKGTALMGLDSKQEADVWDFNHLQFHYKCAHY